MPGPVEAKAVDVIRLRQSSDDRRSLQDVESRPQATERASGAETGGTRAEDNSRAQTDPGAYVSV